MTVASEMIIFFHFLVHLNVSQSPFFHLLRNQYHIVKLWKPHEFHGVSPHEFHDCCIPIFFSIFSLNPSRCTFPSSFWWLIWGAPFLHGSRRQKWRFDIDTTTTTVMAQALAEREMDLQLPGVGDSSHGGFLLAKNWEVNGHEIGHGYIMLT